MKKYTVRLSDGAIGRVQLRYYPRAKQVVTVTTDTGDITGEIAEVLKVR